MIWIFYNVLLKIYFTKFCVGLMKISRHSYDRILWLKSYLFIVLALLSRLGFYSDSTLKNNSLNRLWWESFDKHKVCVRFFVIFRNYTTNNSITVECLWSFQFISDFFEVQFLILISLVYIQNKFEYQYKAILTIWHILNYKNLYIQKINS